MSQRDPQAPIEVRAEDLPFSCPPQGHEVFSAHPRVFLPLEERNNVTCPYCGQRYLRIP